MKRYEITMFTKGGQVKHVVRAKSMDAAKSRAQRAHPYGQIVAFAELRS